MGQTEISMITNRNLALTDAYNTVQLKYFNTGCTVYGRRLSNFEDAPLPKMLVGAMKTDLLFIFTNNYGYNALYNYSCKKIAEIIEELDNAALEPHFQVLA